jgi:hypothetical protein
MEILNLRAVVPQDKMIKIFDIHGNERDFKIPGRLSTELMLENLDVGNRLRENPSSETVKQTFEVIWKIFAILQPELTFKEFLSFPLTQADLARIITFIFNAATPDIEEEKKTE